MPRRLRCASGGFAYHVLNRAVGRGHLFDKNADFAAFEKVLRQAQDWRPMRPLAYCVMPNHRHLVLWPRAGGHLSVFLRWLSVTHTQRWHSQHHTSGSGPLYQGRFQSFPIEADDHLLTVCRYVERSALRAGLAGQARASRWSGLWQRAHESGEGLLSAGPVALPEDWVKHVNRVQSQGELEAVRRTLQRGSPFGMADWQERTAKLLGLESTLRPRGRPAQEKPEHEHF
ncbi:MAG TPA: transposase [Gemmataceae bacterium]|nr:transposase [Gemmataceae bacterium]